MKPSLKQLQIKMNNFNVQEGYRTPQELEQMASHNFSLQYARAGKFFNIEWMPTEHQFDNDVTERIWPSFQR